MSETAEIPQPSPAPTPGISLAIRSRQASIYGEALLVLQSLAKIVAIALFVITFLLQAFQIPSQSMENTLLIGDYLFVDKVHFAPEGRWPRILPYAAIHRGDIIVFKWPVHPDQHLVKRVLGVPGDRIHLSGGRVFVNGAELREGYAVYKGMRTDFFRDNFPTHRVSAQVTTDWWLEFPKLVRNGDLLVPEDCYFVLGDNRDESFDSRYWGFVPRDNIVGRPFMIYFSVSPPDPLAMSTDGRMASLMARLRRLPEQPRWRRAFHFVE